MAKRRTKKRTHIEPNEDELAKIPRSMVIRLGLAHRNHSLAQLVKDFRNIMQPYTAINLRERKTNKLKDFIVMAGPLNVSHLMIFTQSEKGTTSFKIAKMSQGPTLNFTLTSYSLSKDIRKFLRHPKSLAKDSTDFSNPPLLVLNGFPKPAIAQPYEKTLITTFQNMFPPINPQQIKVSSIKRVLILSKDPKTDEIDLRHYSIETKPVEISKNVKKLINSKNVHTKKIPNLSKINDISDFLLDPNSNSGFTSDSELSELEEDSIVQIRDTSAISASNTIKKHDEVKDEDEDNIPIPEKSVENDKNENVNNDSEPNVKKRAVKLIELGPRMKFKLVKIEDGNCTGKVLYHSLYSKTKNEVKQLDKIHATREKEKQKRKKEQLQNVQVKKAKKDAKKLRHKENLSRKKNNKSENESLDPSDTEIKNKNEDDSDELFSS
ncbi:Brix domain-containing protein [Ascoidea rubescens DSM 1968]|uniref:Brix-domain-containing protein n=1 Tax=Ascoidea rubescens DSM 1968 TaxID=1344418 RepID=A0A1D2VLV2_9ASCO|nr:Brix-domain-containing protein [Ascoidea rubescens DSM 1968]ODV62590.1 Brix-domain-containing protein [Ascoidea rubescens DSM 1968]